MRCLFHNFHVDFMLPSAPVGRRHGGWVVLPRREHEKQQKQRLFGDPGRSGAQGRFGAQISVTTQAIWSLVFGFFGLSLGNPISFRKLSLKFISFRSTS
jgi:hypothetical protein